MSKDDYVRAISAWSAERGDNYGYSGLLRLMDITGKGNTADLTLEEAKAFFEKYCIRRLKMKSHRIGEPVKKMTRAERKRVLQRVVKEWAEQQLAAKAEREQKRNAELDIEPESEDENDEK